MQLLRSHPAFSFGRVADFDSWLRHPFTTFPPVGQWLNEVIPGLHQGRPAADVYEDAEAYHVRLELPGVRKEDIQVDVQDRLLQVSAERRETSGDKSTSFSLSRSITVPEGVATDGISAKLEDGLLHLRLPKQEQRQPRSIEIQ